MHFDSVIKISNHYVFYLLGFACYYVEIELWACNFTAFL
jgi:hypothetical protein